MILRPYQVEAFNGVIREFDAGKRATLVVCPTGGGKTVIAGHVIKHFLDTRPGKVMVLAHRGELLEQARSSIQRICGGQIPDLEKAEHRAGEKWYTNSRVIASSIQTHISGRGNTRRMHKFNPLDFDLVWFDEVHHGPSASWRAVMDYYCQNPDLKVLGVTATPDRLDGEALGQIMDSVAYEYTMADAIKDAWLVPIKQRIIHVHGLDFSQCRTTAGDLNGGDLAAAMESEKPLHGVAASAIELCIGRTLVFCVTVKQAIKLSEILNRYRPESARYVHGKTDQDERKATLGDFEAGRFDFLCNVGVLTEGYDEPAIANIVQARPTKSRALYQQMVGRGTRPLAGLVDPHETAEARHAAIAASDKPCLYVIDFTGNTGKHKLITTFDILGGNYSEEERELAAREAASDPQDVQEALKKAREAKLKREAERQQRLEEERRKWKEREHIRAQKVNYTVKEIDPFNVFDLQRPPPSLGDFVAASEKVYAELEKMKVENPRRLNKRDAESLMRELWGMRRQGLCTSMKMLKIFGEKGLPTRVKWKPALAAMDKIKAAGWRVGDELRAELTEMMNETEHEYAGAFDAPPPGE